MGLVKIIAERLDKSGSIPVQDTEDVLHIREGGIDEYYKVTTELISGNRADFNRRWFTDSVVNFYKTHEGGIPKKLEIIYESEF